MRFLVFSLVFPALFFSQNASGQQETAPGKWTLEKCVDYALKNNIQVREAEVTARSTSADHLQSKLNFLPVLDVNGTLSDDFGNGFNPQTFSFAQGNSQDLQMQATATLPIFTGLQQIYNVQRTKYELLASKYDYENAQKNIALNVAQAYLNILLNKEIEKIGEKQRDLTMAQKEIVANRIKAGSQPETAIYDVDATLGRNEADIINEKNAVTLSVLTLAQLLQLKDFATFDVETPEIKVETPDIVPELTAQSIYDYAVNNQPGIKSSEARVMSADVARKIAYGGYSPTINALGSLSTGWFSQDANTVYGELSYLGVPIEVNGTPIELPSGSTPRGFGDDLRTNFRQVIGLQMDIPLFTKGQKVINVQKAKLQLEMRHLQLEDSKNQLRQDIETAYTNANGAAQSFLANKKSLEASQKAYQATETRYKAGMASNFDIQQAKENMIAAESQLIQAKYTYVFRMKILDFYEGKPITLNNNP